MLLLWCLQADYKYCRTSVSITQPSTPQTLLSLQLCPAGFACMEIDKSQSEYVHYDKLSDKTYYSCVVGNETYCKELCSEDCIRTDDEVSYAEHPTSYTGFEFMRGYYCPAGKQKNIQNEHGEAVPETEQRYCLSKWYKNGNRIYNNITLSKRQSCNELVAKELTNISRMPDVAINNVTGLLFPPSGYTEKECAQYCNGSCQYSDRPDVILVDRFSPATGYQKRFAFLNGLWTCPAGQELYPKNSDITDDEEQKQNEKLSPGAILAIVLACLVVLCAATGVLIWWLMKKDVIKLPQRIHDRFAAGL